ncbi:MAG: glycine--tRNA ligase subunit beta [Chloroflexota bacterium]
MTRPLDFQSIIMELQAFWAARGCLIWQPYHAEMGAGTMNPATFLRVLGPEPWNVGYVEPSIRPDDGRYGKNPNRFYQHYQFQVILKPDPGNPQQLYLQSLEALGVDPRQHDIRFVEDNWEQPALAAWGLGWEVWLDGLEITQFTYFQQAGGISLDPVSVELTYGLERIAMATQQVQEFGEVHWTEQLTYGDMHLQSERDYSTYAFELAGVERLTQMFALYEAEAEAALAGGLILPAYDYVLKCSHAFNVLDTRGAIGVTERQTLFGRIRDLSRRVAEAYIEQRQRLEFPWLKEEGIALRSAQTKSTRTGIQTIPLKEAPAHFLFEIGTEELPPSDIEAALEQLRERVPLLLAELRLAHGEIWVMATPRRLVIYVEKLGARQEDVEQIFKGPPASRAYDEAGKPTKAAEGFARSRGVNVEDLDVRDVDDGRYVVAVVHSSGRPAGEVLSEALPDLIATLRFDKPMRWNHTNVAFSRPIRWLLALHGDQVVPFEYAGLRSSNVTRGLLSCDPLEMQVSNPAEYFAKLKAQGILLDVAERKARIEGQVKALGDEVQGEISADPDLLTEVTHLVETPTALRGSFSQNYLDLPDEVLIAVMKKHQRYFPVERGGKILPYFITVANKPYEGQGTEKGYELITRGNEAVIHARFADAVYFMDDDKKLPLEAYLPRLDTLTFQKDLGSMLDKTRRIERLVAVLAPRLGLDNRETEVALRAARLCKADLATQMVVDMTSLQGIMGRYYAFSSGEPEEVATAIYEHYLPRFLGDTTPQTLPGLLVGLADRLDTLVGLFTVGLAPSGAKDPFAQRRAALGIVINLIVCDLELDLRDVLDMAVDQLPVDSTQETRSDCLTFIVERLRNHLREQGYRYDVVDAVLAGQGYNPARAARGVVQLTAWVNRDDWHTILPEYSRCVRITRDQEEIYPVETSAFVEPTERKLFEVLQQVESKDRLPGSVDDFLHSIVLMIPVINQFFDDVLVMAEDKVLQHNRLGMLQRIAALAEGVADMSRLEGF